MHDAFVAELARPSEPWRAAIHVDMDHFGSINRGYNWQAADKVLAEVAHLLGSMRSPRAFLARVGGDKFLMLLLESVDAAAERAENIRSLVANLFANRFEGLTCSVSVVEAATLGDTLTVLRELNVRAKAKRNYVASP